MRMRGLDGTKGEMEAEFVGSASGLARVLRQRKCATSAGDNGAINVWIDDRGQYRGESMRRMVTMEAETFKSLKATQAWYRKWLERIQ